MTRGPDGCSKTGSRDARPLGFPRRHRHRERPVVRGRRPARLRARGAGLRGTFRHLRSGASGDPRSDSRRGGPDHGRAHVKVLLLDKASGVLRVGARQGSACPRLCAPGWRRLVRDRRPDGTAPLHVGCPARSPEHLRRAGPRAEPADLPRYSDQARGRSWGSSPSIRRGPAYTAGDLSYLASFADQAALAIEKAQLFSELNQSYADLQRAQDELIRAEKLRALGQMSAGIAHDLNNMLAAILGQVELLRSARGTPRCGRRSGPWRRRRPTGRRSSAACRISPAARRHP